MDRLPPGPAERAEIVVYLQTLISWLSTDPWPEDRQLHGPALTPAAIERKLRITAAGGAGEGSLDADGLARQCRRLVILGGSGSGKTWLAKRTARRCAEDALEALAAGDTPDEVELPLYTTCAHLFSAAAAADKDIREAAVQSALSQIGDLGSSRITTALRLFLTDRNAPTVLVIDSLDEARGSEAPLLRADTLPWRIILTSRPSSWNHQLRIEKDNDSHRVGELQPLRYPDDVEPFIQRWFGRQPELGQQLAAQIAQRPDLQQAATVPLMLAFYCILGGDGPLPDRRAVLYTSVVRRMLTGRWHGSRAGSDHLPDPAACLPVLQAWAWSGAACNHPVSGVGTWADDILTDRVRLGKADAQALDHVATPVGGENWDTGQTPRRFVHWSIREQFVADKVAGLSADDAVEALLPHLWYDPDWEYAAPAALAMHPGRDQVLRDLMRRAARSDQVPADLSVIDAMGEFRRFLARVASHSSERDWSPEAAGMIGQARVELARSSRIGDLGGGAHWETSSHQGCAALLKLLDTQIDRLAARWLDPQAMLSSTFGAGALGLAHRVDPALVDSVAELAASAEDKRQVRQRLLMLLRTETSGPAAEQLARRVAELEPAAEDKRQAAGALLRVLAWQVKSPGVGFSPLAGDVVSGLVELVVQLAATGEDKEQARAALLTLLATRPFRAATALVNGVVRLAATGEDKEQARAALLRLLDTPNSDWVADALVRGVVQLDPTPEDQQQAREILLTLLATPAFWSASSLWAPPLVDWVAQLGPTPGAQWQACERLLRLLDTQRESSVAASLMNGVVQLATSGEDRQRLREVLFTLLDAAQQDSTAATSLAAAVAQLDPAPQDQQQARAALLRLLAIETNSPAAAQLVHGIVQLDPAPEDQQHARARLLTLLDAAQQDSTAATSLAAAVAQLDPAPQDQQQARAALLRLLAIETNSPAAAQLVHGIVQLDPAPEDQQHARARLLTLLDAAQQDSTAATSLAAAVAQLDPAPQDQQQARAALLRLLAIETDSPTAAQLVHGMAELDPAPQDQQQARAALLRLLAIETDSRAATALMDGMAELDPAPQDQLQTREILLSWLDDPAFWVASSAWTAPLVGWMARLDPTPESKRQVREILLLRLAETLGSTSADDALLQTVAKLDPTPEDQRRIREVLLTLLDAQRDSTVAASLVTWVARLDPTPEDQQQARAALLRLLAIETDSSEAAQLLRGMAWLDPTVADLSTWRDWSVTPTAELLATARWNSPLADWLAALPQLTQPAG